MASLRLCLFLLCHCFVLPCLGITCAPGQKRVYHKEKCEPCEDRHFQPVASSDIFCNLCSVCNEGSGTEYVQQCTKTADAKCRCRVGFIPVDERDDLCQCPEGSGLTKTDSGVQCRECGYGYFTSKADTLCVKWKDCAPWGVKSGGSKTSDVVCNTGSEVTQTSVHSTAVNLNYSRSSLTSAETSPTTATTNSTLTPPLSHTTTTTTTTTTKSVNDTNYGSAVSCKQVIIPCMKRHMKKMNKTDGACRRPVEECGDVSRSSLVKSSQGIL
ncbi:uncharacterized protein [Paramormyrops kingsleyae]|uniref:uncharacterized protein isoform X2 n=1 Tax=Paramormyrops kingsleyae TaxID=1676925 RepID=UPI000CD617E3|nr:tumor necrosis factor receptor superfamily member 4-like isoform X2 [Paramormyrops kingsleyae]